MKLDAWLRQDHPLEESLHVIECLCQAVNEVHDRGDAVGALEPQRIEVGSDGRCDLSAASQGSPSPDYAAPDAESDAPAAADDVYAVGVITWEILAGRPAGESPRHLAEVRPDLPRELADAITACLERSADWRPKDLTYLAQMAASRQKGAGRAPEKRRARTPRQGAARTRSRQQSRRTWPLLAALVVVLGLAALAWRQFGGTGGAPGTAPPGPSAAAAPTPTAVVPPVAEPTPATPTSPAATEAPLALPGTDTTARGEQAAPETAAPDTAPPAPPPSSASAPVTEPAAAPQAVAPRPPATSAAPAAPPPSTLPAQRPTPSRPAAPPQPQPAPPATEPAPNPAPGTSSAGQPPSPNSGAQATPSVPTPPREPAVLTVVSPLEVKRPGKAMLDLRGQGFGPQHRAQVLPVKKAPRGIRIVGQKRVSDTLITVLVELSEDAETGDYGIAVEDGLGARTEAVIFKVTK